MRLLMLSGMRTGSSLVSCLLNVQSGARFWNELTEWTHAHGQDGLTLLRSEMNMQPLADSSVGVIGSGETLENVRKRCGEGPRDYSARARDLLALLPDETHVMWLLRGFEDVANSLLKRGEGTERTFRLLEMTIREWEEVQPEVTVRLESFVRDPKGTLDEALGVVGAELRIEPSTYSVGPCDPVYCNPYSKFGLSGSVPVGINPDIPFSGCESYREVTGDVEWRRRFRELKERYQPLWEKAI